MNNYHESFQVAKTGQKIAGLGPQGVLPVRHAEAGHHRGGVEVLLAVVVAWAALAGVAVIRRPDLIADLLPEDGLGVVPVVATVILRVEAFVGVALADDGAEGGQNDDDDDDDGGLGHVGLVLSLLLEVDLNKNI